MSRHARLAERFRYYAALCLEFADRPDLRAFRTKLQASAERWQRDAEMLEQDTDLLSSSHELLASVPPVNSVLITGSRKPLKRLSFRDRWSSNDLRKRAQRARDIAETFEDANNFDQMITIAEGYERAAERMDRCDADAASPPLK